MKTVFKCCLSILLPWLLMTTFVAASEAIPYTQQGKLIWADLYTSDVEASLNFYTKTFGWTVKKFGANNERYHLLYSADKAVAGVLARSAQRNKTEKALWIGSFATENVQTTVTRAANNNAVIILKPHDFALYGKRAVIADPQGGIVALLDINNHEKAQQKMGYKWNWAQLFSVNPSNAASFYQDSFHYTVEEVTNNKGSYYLSQQDEIIASIVKLPASFEQRDRWVNFVDVANLIETLNRAKKNGAEIIYQPEGAQLAIIIDPNGAFIGLTEQESE